MNTKHIITDKNYYISGGCNIFWSECKDSIWIDRIEKNDSGDEPVFYIPNTINGKPVTDISLDNVFGLYPKGRIIAEEDNEYFCVKDGSLFTKDMKEMIFLAPDKNDGTVIVPDCVEVILEDALIGHYENLVLPEGCRVIAQYGLDSRELKRLYLSKSIERFCFKSFIGVSPEEVFYGGSEQDRANIDNCDDNFNSGVIDAKWHYNCPMPKTEDDIN